MIPLSIMLIESDADRAYMTALYQKHYPLMFVMAMRYVNQLSDAEDIVSNSCESLIKHIDTILHKQLWLTLYQREPFYLV